MAEAENAQLLARVLSLSPQAVLDRGYAVIWKADGELVRHAAALTVGDGLRVRVADGEFGVRVSEPAPPRR